MGFWKDFFSNMDEPVFVYTETDEPQRQPPQELPKYAGRQTVENRTKRIENKQKYIEAEFTVE